MPIVALDLTDDEAARVDAIAEREKRARKNQAAILLMERVAEIERESEAQP
jgi:hypothetical protein